MERNHVVLFSTKLQHSFPKLDLNRLWKEWCSRFLPPCRDPASRVSRTTYSRRHPVSRSVSSLSRSRRLAATSAPVEKTKKSIHFFLLTFLVGAGNDRAPVLRFKLELGRPRAEKVDCEEGNKWTFLPSFVRSFGALKTSTSVKNHFECSSCRAECNSVCIITIFRIYNFNRTE